MVLVFDIGNTFIKTGIFDREELIQTDRRASAVPFKSDFQKHSIDGCIISSVAPKVTQSVKKVIQNDFGITPLIISKDWPFSFRIDYETPETLGIDRLCGVEGALFFNKRENPASDYTITIDFGTATTINIVNRSGAFEGGLIAPGVTMMSAMLNKNTSQLPNVGLDEYKGIIGKSTNSAIASGVLNATVSLIEKTVCYLNLKTDGGGLCIYITGGNAPNLLPHLNFEYKYEPLLILYGAYSLFSKSIAKKV